VTRYFILVFWLFLSCQPKQDTLEFAGYGCLNLSEFDLVQESQYYVQSYEPFKSVGTISFPLSKVIRNDSALTLIGVSAQNVIDIKPQLFAFDTLRYDSLVGAFVGIESEGDFVYRAMLPIKQLEIFASMVIDSDSSTVYELFEDRLFLTRLICHE